VGCAGAIKGKVVDFDACCKEAVNLLFGRLFDVADVKGDFGWCGERLTRDNGGENLRGERMARACW
jgi:hypothetical protein